MIFLITLCSPFGMARGDQQGACSFGDISHIRDLLDATALVQLEVPDQLNALASLLCHEGTRRKTEALSGGRAIQTFVTSLNAASQSCDRKLFQQFQQMSPETLSCLASSTTMSREELKSASPLYRCLANYVAYEQNEIAKGPPPQRTGLSRTNSPAWELFQRRENAMQRLVETEKQSILKDLVHRAQTGNAGSADWAYLKSMGTTQADWFRTIGGVDPHIVTRLTAARMAIRSGDVGLAKDFYGDTYPKIGEMAKTNTQDAILATNQAYNTVAIHQYLSEGALRGFSLPMPSLFSLQYPR